MYSKSIGMMFILRHMYLVGLHRCCVEENKYEFIKNIGLENCMFDKHDKIEVNNLYCEFIHV